MPMPTDPLASFDAFVAAVRARLEAGRAQYGDRSFERPPAELLGEIGQEALDLAGWGFVLFERLRRLEAREANRPHPGLRIEVHIAFQPDELAAIDYAARVLGLSRDLMIRAALSKFIRERLPASTPTFAQRFPGVLPEPPAKGKRRRKRATPEPDRSLPCLPLPRICYQPDGEDPE